MSKSDSERNIFVDPSDEEGATVWTRAEWIGELARADGERLQALWADWLGPGPAPAHEILRGPEIGLVMTRGRVGGEGRPFNLGEATATRCSVRLLGGGAPDAPDAPIDGHAYALGRDKDKAVLSALIDALMQTSAAASLATSLLAPLQAERLADAAKVARKAAATKVDFFTMVRGEDA